MSIFNQLTKEEMKDMGLTHTGYIFGFVPIWIGDKDSEGPTFVERNWVPEWLFDIGKAMHDTATMFMPFDDPRRMFILKITGEIDYDDEF